MGQSVGSDAPPRKLLASAATRIRVAVASGLVLLIGVWLAPHETPTATSAVEERPAPLLEQEVQAREVVRPFQGVPDIAARVRGQAVSIVSAADPAAATRNDFSERRPRERIAGFGVVVSDDRVLTHALALQGRSRVRVAPDGRDTVDAQVAAYDPWSGLVLLHAQALPASAPAFPHERPVAGTLVAAVGRAPGRDIVVPAFITTVDVDRYHIDSAGGSLLSGMPVYNSDGELLAVLGDASQGDAYPVRDAMSRLRAAEAAGRPPSSVGVGLQALSGPLTEIFGQDGVLVSDVVPGGPADLAGIQPGDVLLQVGDAPVASLDAAAQALRSLEVGTAATLRVRRGRALRDVEPTPAPAYEVAFEASAADAATGAEARTLFAASLLARADIPGTARVLTVDGRPLRSRAQAEQALRRARQPLVLRLAHDGRTFFAVVEATR